MASIKSTKKVVKKVAKKAKAAKKISKKTTAKSARKAPQKNKRTTSTKKSMPKLTVVSGRTCFWVKDGTVLQSLVDLNNALSAMQEEVFAYHVRRNKNDFADWVECVLKDKECATALRKSKKPHTARTVVVKYLKGYTL